MIVGDHNLYGARFHKLELGDHGCQAFLQQVGAVESGHRNAQKRLRHTGHRNRSDPFHIGEATLQLLAEGCARVHGQVHRLVGLPSRRLCLVMGL